MNVDLRTGELLILREAEPKDAAQVLAYIRKTFSETENLATQADEVTYTVEEEARILKEIHESPRRLFLLGEIGGEIVGHVSMGGSSKVRLRHQVEMAISVPKEHQGKGIGKHLLTHAIAWAKAGGVLRKIDLTVRVDNAAAIALYERCGFVQEGLVRRLLCIDGVFYDGYMMGLLID